MLMIEDGEDEAYRYMADVIELSDTEVEYFGLDMEQYRDTTGEDADTLRLRPAQTAFNSCEYRF